jgi:hypothetical protein
MYVYPRIDPQVGLELINDYASMDLQQLRLVSLIEHPQQFYYPTGTPVPNKLLQALRASVRQSVDELGFPKPHRSSVRLINQFDHELAGLLHRTMQIIPADAGSEDVWAFISLALLPEVAAWRFPERDPSRLTGQPRNVFRRLWWRAYILGDGPKDPPAILGEDQLVNIMERPTIGGDPRIARAFCRAYLSDDIAELKLQPMFLMRESAKRFIRFTPFLAIGTLPDPELGHLMREIVSSAASALRLVPKLST